MKQRLSGKSTNDFVSIQAEITGKTADERQKILGSDAGGELAVVIYTVLQSAKLTVLDPEGYFTDVIDRMARVHPINRLSELLPWNWQRRPGSLVA